MALKHIHSLKPARFVRREWPLLVLASTWVLFFCRLLIGQSVYFLDDLRTIFYPLEHVYATAQAAGHLPAWSAVFGFGHPLIAWGQLGFFTPVHLVLRAMDVHPLALLQLSILIYFALGLLGFYVLLRLQKLPNTSAALGALVFVFSGFSIGHLNHVNFYTGTMVLPWLLIFILRFVLKPHLAGAGLVALCAAVIALSAQPQVVLYCYVVAALFGLITAIQQLRHHPSPRRYLARLLAGLFASAVVALCVSSLAILPLSEFIPNTERNGDLPTAELYEFSYPPAHAITLLLPYFFGDHESYWGAKGFQELAAYVGIIPLLLTGVAIFSWRPWRTLRIIGLVLCCVGLAFALGRYSPLYRYLVENHLLTTLANPGRFVFFIDTGIAFLAAVGLHDIAAAAAVNSRRARWLSLMGSGFLFLILVPFFLGLGDPLNKRWITELATSLTTFDISLILAGLGWLVFMFGSWQPRRRFFLAALLGVCAATFIALGWNYNPLTPRRVAFAPPPFAANLAHGPVPARLYARPQLLVHQSIAEEEPATSFSARFSLVHPITPATNNPCYSLPLYYSGVGTNQLRVELREEPAGPVIAGTTINGATSGTTSNQQFCLPAMASRLQYLALVSDDPTGLNAYYRPSPKGPVTYFVRVSNPTHLQMQESQKNSTLVIKELIPSLISDDLVLLTRHMQAITNTSSARWIGALSIRPYREFIELFFANDKDEVIDGDGIHFLQKYRPFFNLAGVTHFTQIVPNDDADAMLEANFTLLEQTSLGDQIGRLYANPDAFPKAFLIPSALFIAADDDARATMLMPNFDPRQVATITGPKPPPAEAVLSTLAELPPSAVTPRAADITHYTDTRVEVSVDLEQPAWLIVSDATTPQWQTFIDGQSVPSYTAYTVFKAAWVPAGQHTITWQYLSPALEQAKKISVFGLVGLMLLFVPALWRLRKKYYRGSASSQVGVPPQTS